MPTPRPLKTRKTGFGYTKSKPKIKKSSLLKEGDVIKLTSKHTVEAMVPRHFLYENCKGDYTLNKGSVRLKDDFEYLQGLYIVTRTEMTGGGTGHGRHDVYPDGHKVTCISEDGEHEVSFYQTGCFKNMIEKIKVGGRAKQIWVIDEDVE